MSADVMVRFETVSKKYRRYESQPFLLRTALLSLIGRRPKPRELWPVKDVSFEVSAGETVGIVGLNGSGKSTLLRLIAGACFPTAGRVAVRGRIAPLFSLGVGFHPDMTGRECVGLNATLLGLSPSEVTERLPSIIAFAELESFVDTPMRHYSSGMQARLGFAVAAHTTPDLLLIDEVLAVGDHEFRKKCTERLRAMSGEGTTIILVSHSPSSVRELCTRVLWLKDGHIARDGSPDDVVDAYLQG